MEPMDGFESMERIKGWEREHFRVLEREQHGPMYAYELFGFCMCFLLVITSLEKARLERAPSQESLFIYHE